MTEMMATIEIIQSDVDRKGVQQMAAIDMVKSDVDKKGVEQIALMDKVQRDLYKKVADLSIAPIGTITAWVTRPALGGNYVNIPPGWVRCDGKTIPNPSIWAGMTTPNLNGEKRFLRGGPDSAMLSLEEDQLQNHKHDVADPGHRHDYDDKYTKNSGTGSGPADGDGYFGVSHPSTSSWGFTGLKVEWVAAAYRRGNETRPRNMSVAYIIRVW